MTALSPMDKLGDALRRNTLVRIVERFGDEHADSHLKDLVIDEAGPGREIKVLGCPVVNFGSDSFLGLDRDPRVQEAVRRGLRRWGTHNGSSRAFASVRANIEAEEKLADWLGVESVLIFPSVMLANLAAIPGLVGRQDAVVLDEQAHSSMQEAAKIARANGSRVATFPHNDPRWRWSNVLETLRPYRCALVCVDGVYSMSGMIPPMAELNEVARANNAVLYIDDAHGTGVLGEQGRGTVLESLGSYDNTFVIGSLSKAFSCAGGFIGCTEPFHRLLKIRSSPYVFGGPVVPCYLEAISDGHRYPSVRRIRHAPPRGSTRTSDTYPRALRPRPDNHGRGDTDRLGLDRRRGRHPPRRQVPLRSWILRPVGPVPRRPIPLRRAPRAVQRQSHRGIDRRPARCLRGLDRYLGHYTVGRHDVHGRPARPPPGPWRLFQGRHTPVTLAGRGRVLLIMLVAVIALAVGETLLSKGMKQVGRAGGGWLDQTTAVARNGWVAAGLLLLLVHVGLYMLALEARTSASRCRSPRRLTLWPRSWRDSTFAKMSAPLAGPARS